MQLLGATHCPCALRALRTLAPRLLRALEVARLKERMISLDFIYNNGIMCVAKKKLTGLGLTHVGGHGQPPFMKIWPAGQAESISQIMNSKLWKLTWGRGACAGSDRSRPAPFPGHTDSEAARRTNRTAGKCRLLSR